jgi:predicted O-linked N-acetylglucosamine transferase (SPINDLY family)
MLAPDATETDRDGRAPGSQSLEPESAADGAAMGTAGSREADSTPPSLEYWLDLGNAQLERGDVHAAEEAAQLAFELDPRSLAACTLYGRCLAAQHRWVDAVAVYASLDPSTPRDHAFHFEFGQACFNVRWIEQAIEQFVASLTLKPDRVAAHSMLGFSLAAMGLHLEASECFRTVATLEPRDAQAWSSLVHQRLHACSWERLDEDMVRLNEAIRSSSSARATPFSYISMENTAEEQRVCARRFSQATYAGMTSLAADPRPPRDVTDRIRVGYLSSDFYHHATSMLMVELLEQHDRSKLDVTLFSYGTDDGSALRSRIIASSARPKSTS